MRILYLTSNIDTRDGTGTYSRGLILAAQRAGHEPVVLLPERYKGKTKLDPAMPVKRALPSYKTMADSFLKTWLAAWRISRLPDVNRIDLVHGLFERYAPLARVLARRLRVPYIVSAVGSYALEGFERRRRLAGRYRTAFEEADGVAAISRFTAELLENYAPRSNIEIIYPGIDTPAGEAPPESREPILLSVGAVKPRKGQDVLLKAFALLAPQFPEWRYVVVGESDDTELMESLRELAEGHGISDRVELRGHINHDELIGLYRRASVFALAPRTDEWKIEGYGLVFLEAATHNLPVVCTPECGFAEHLQTHPMGQLAEDDTPECVRQALESLMRDETRRVELGRAAAAFASTRTWNAAFEPLNALYEKACQRR